MRFFFPESLYLRDATQFLPHMLRLWKNCVSCVNLCELRHVLFHIFFLLRSHQSEKIWR